jgi:hypothetical protein
LRREMFIKPQGTSLDGARVHRIATRSSSNVVVEMLEDRRAYVRGETLSVASWDLVEALEVGDLVAYEPSYLAKQGLATPGRPLNKYRRGTVARVLEGALVQVRWNDGLGPSTLPDGVGHDLRPASDVVLAAGQRATGHALVRLDRPRVRLLFPARPLRGGDPCAAMKSGCG